MPRFEHATRWRSVLGTATAAVLLVAVTLPAAAVQAQTDNSCSLLQPAFCDTFALPSEQGGRTGQLDPELWSVARVSEAVNPSQGLVNQFLPTEVMRCLRRDYGIVVPNDYFFCGPEYGESMHWMEAFDDGENYVYNSARVRQPFDFAGRTGKITFDVDAKTAGSHGWWIELWLTDEPIAAPHNNIVAQLPRNAVAISFFDTCGASVPAGDIGAPTGGVSEVQVVRDYRATVVNANQNATQNGVSFKRTDCYKVGPDQFNHFQVLIDQQRLEVWASDAQGHPHAGPGNPLRLVAAAEGLNLPFTRGYVHLQHAHYNAAKSAPGVSSSQTYHWDNVGFDGPILPIAAQFSVPDAMTSGRASGAVNLGYQVRQNGLDRGPLALTNVATGGITAATLTFNAWLMDGQRINYRVNDGAWRTWTGSQPASGAAWQMAAAVPLELSELREGTNTIDFASLNGDWTVVSNIDLILAGGAPPAPRVDQSAAERAPDAPEEAAPAE
jgi:hypothetical protein